MPLGQKGQSRTKTVKSLSSGRAGSTFHSNSNSGLRRTEDEDNGEDQNEDDDEDGVTYVPLLSLLLFCLCLPRDLRDDSEEMFRESRFIFGVFE